MKKWYKKTYEDFSWTSLLVPYTNVFSLLVTTLVTCKLFVAVEENIWKRSVYQNDLEKLLRLQQLDRSNARKKGQLLQQVLLVKFDNLWKGRKKKNESQKEILSKKEAVNYLFIRKLECNYSKKKNLKQLIRERLLRRNSIPWYDGWFPGEIAQVEQVTCSASLRNLVSLSFFTFVLTINQNHTRKRKKTLHNHYGVEAKNIENKKHGR